LGDLLQTLRALEAELLSPSAEKADRVARLLAEDFVEYGRSGRVHGRAEVISALAARAPSTEVTAFDFSVHLVAPNTALLRYVSCHQAAGKAYALRSSIWQIQNGQWRILFHQGTPCSPPTGAGREGRIPDDHA
jgi:hypothetical protein